MFEAVDIITLIKGNNYDELNLDVGEALKKRSDVGHKMLSRMKIPPVTHMLGFSWDLHMFNQ